MLSPYRSFCPGNSDVRRANKQLFLCPSPPPALLILHPLPPATPSPLLVMYACDGVVTLNNGDGGAGYAVMRIVPQCTVFLSRLNVSSPPLAWRRGGPALSLSPLGLSALFSIFVFVFLSFSSFLSFCCFFPPPFEILMLFAVNLGRLCGVHFV